MQGKGGRRCVRSKEGQLAPGGARVLAPARRPVGAQATGGRRQGVLRSGDTLLARSKSVCGARKGEERRKVGKEEKEKEEKEKTHVVQLLLRRRRRCGVWV